MFERLRERRQLRKFQASEAAGTLAGLPYYDLRPRSVNVPDLGYTIVPAHPAPFGKSFDDILADIAALRWSGLVEYHRPELSLSALYTWAFEQGRMLSKIDHDGNQLTREPVPRG